ncbi:hypothetical protein [Balneola vulgaris]|jgi:hypothetical protein|uniref:hypothetical protein n=1 Tax=Balneola vulgaris TaxID=287535 RepID=UPI0003759BB0|nr:hypothetical protein [Balneola vulgaris]
MLKKLHVLFTLGFLFILAAPAQAQINTSTLTVYLDCRDCNSEFVRSEIDFVTFVRDQSVAEVQLLVTRQRTGGGGSQFSLDFIGLGEYHNKDNKVVFITPQSDTDEIQRNKLVKYIKLGLVSYLAEKDIIDRLDITYSGTRDNASSEEEKVDPWNGWNFELGASTNFSGEESRKDYRINGNFRAQRITENWKVNFNYWQNYRNRKFTYTDDNDQKVTNTYITEEQNFFGLIAKSLSDHWTAGTYLRGQSSTQNNIDLRIAATPSLEYSVFPYSEFARRLITFRYGMLVEQNYYTESTIFKKEEELLVRQELTVESKFTQPWGGVDGRIELRNYMHDFSKNSLNFNLSMNMRISRALSFRISGRYSVINDQLSIPGGDLSDAERLLNLRQQATSYNFGGSVGLEFNFGSLYNNVVNSRL